MFTIDPVSGAPDQVVVSANWGLGDSVVAGDVTPDVAVVDRASGTLVSYQLGGKEVMTVADGAGTLETETPAGLRSTPVLSPAQAGELARVGLAIEKLYGEPVDVEWARADGELWVVQARPITDSSRPAGRLGACRFRRPVERQPGRGLPVDQRQPGRGAARRHDPCHLVVHRTVDVTDDFPAERARVPGLRADRRALLRERERVDVA